MGLLSSDYEPSDGPSFEALVSRFKYPMLKIINFIISGGSANPRRQHLRHCGQARSPHTPRASQWQRWPVTLVSGNQPTKEHQEQETDIFVSYQRFAERPPSDAVRRPEGDPGVRPLLQVELATNLRDVSQYRRRPLLGPSPCWKGLLAFSNKGSIKTLS